MTEELLTPAQCARLRATVDADALRRLLAAVPPEARLPLIIACVDLPTHEEFASIGIELPDLSHLPGLPPASDGTGDPRVSFDMNVGVLDPALEELWRAVEDQRLR